MTFNISHFLVDADYQELRPVYTDQSACRVDSSLVFLGTLCAVEARKVGMLSSFAGELVPIRSAKVFSGKDFFGAVWHFGQNFHGEPWRNAPVKMFSNLCLTKQIKGQVFSSCWEKKIISKEGLICTAIWIFSDKF